MNDNKFKYLFKNIGFLTIGSFSTRILEFLLIPLYTYILTTAEYGSYDLVNTTVNLIIPILTADILDSTLRFSLEKNASKKSVFSIACKFFVIGLVLAIILGTINLVFNINSTLRDYFLYYVLMYFTISGAGIISAFARGCDKVKYSSIAGVLSSGSVILLNILFLVILKIGLPGYFCASIIGHLVTIIFLSIKLKVWKYIDFRNIDKTTERGMLEYSRPLIANNIAWWVNNASDRYVVSFFCGISQNGIYSVGYKIPTVLNFIQGIFQQAWMLSAVKEFDGDDKDGFYSNVYSVYNLGMVIACSGVIFVDKFLAGLLYSKDFFNAWVYVPFLTMGFVFVAMSNYLGGIFQAVKQPKIIATSTIIGAIINLIFDLILTQFIGALGAAIATYFSYYIVWQFRIIKVKQFIKININIKRDYLTYVLLILQSIICLTISGALSYLLQFIIVAILVIINLNDCKRLIFSFYSKLSKRNGKSINN